MPNNRYWRPTPRFSVLAAMGVVSLLVACQDASAPAHDDEWASAVVDNIHVRDQATLFGADQRALMPTVSQQGTVSPHPLRAVDLPSNHDASKVLVRFAHSRSKNGEMFTNAFVYSGMKQPPRRVYGFQDGRVRYLFMPQYARVHGAWIRRSARVVLFDDAGKVTAEFDSRTVRGAPPSTLRAGESLPLAAESVAFDGVVGNEVEGACWKELQDNLIAYAVWTATTFAATQAALLCPLTGPAAGEACTKAATLAAAALAAFSKYTETMDRLIQCELSAWISGTNASSSAPPDRTTEIKSASNLMAVIQDFIRQAVAAGTFTCNSDGSSCVYSGAQQL